MAKLGVIIGGKRSITAICNGCATAFPHDFLCIACGHLADPAVIAPSCLLCEDCYNGKPSYCPLALPPVAS